MVTRRKLEEVAAQNKALTVARDRALADAALAAAESTKPIIRQTFCGVLASLSLSLSHSCRSESQPTSRCGVFFFMVFAAGVIF